MADQRSLEQQQYDSHWFSRLLSRAQHVRTPPRQVKQRKSAAGQLPLFADVNIDHLKAKRDK